MMQVKNKHSFSSRLRAFTIWQKLGYLPWKKPKPKAPKAQGSFYKGAFNSIPFLNDDAKRTFTHLLLRPGYMIRDYIKGDNERYLAPLTALIIFYAFFALVSAVLAPVQHNPERKIDERIRIEAEKDADSEQEEMAQNILINTLQIIKSGYLYLTLDKHPEVVDTRAKSALAALENTLRSQGIPLFLGQFFLLWFSLSIALRRFHMGMAAAAATSAYVLCQFSFFMLFAVLFTVGESRSIGLSLMAVLLTVDLHQLLGTGWKQSFKLAFKTGLWYVVLLSLIFLIIGTGVVMVAYFKV